jgi:hypothetical protein
MGLGVKFNNEIDKFLKKYQLRGRMNKVINQQNVWFINHISFKFLSLNTLLSFFLFLNFTEFTIFISKKAFLQMYLKQ